VESRRELIDKVREVIIENYNAYREAGAPDIKEALPEMKTTD
jgi:hypothetical protein